MPLAAVDVDHCFLAIVGKAFQGVDLDLALGNVVHCHAFAGVAIERLAVLLDRRIKRWRLLLLADEARQHVAETCFLLRWQRARRHDIAGAVLGVGLYAEAQCCAVALVICREVFVEPRRLTNAEHHDASGIGIKGTVVTDLFRLENLARNVHEVVGGHFRWLVDEKHTAIRHDAPPPIPA